MRLIEVRLESQSERLEQVIATAAPVNGLDPSIVEQLSVRLEETSAALAQKFDTQLSERMQRFEALSQAMMTMVGEPVDALADKLSQVVRAAAAINSLRADGVETKKLLLEALDKMDQLTDPQ